MDGNSRWAKENGLPRKAGHRRGAEVAKIIAKAARNAHVKYLTLYAFSSENWNRSEEEVSDLMGILRFYIRHELMKLHEENIRVQVIGNRDRLDKDLQKDILTCEQKTANNDGMTVCIALSYGGREEITQAVCAIAKKVEAGILHPSSISETDIEQHLYTHTIPDPDIFIRTGGESRISNFLLWQLAYTELFLLPTYWPDFTAEHLNEVIDAYHQRERRYGGRDE